MLGASDPSLMAKRDERRNLPFAVLSSALLSSARRHSLRFKPDNFSSGKADTGADRALYQLGGVSGADATIAINFAHDADLRGLKPNFSTKCLLMDRSVPTLCIEALLREASNWPMCRC